MNNIIKNNDLSFGENEELKNFEIIKNTFDITLKRSIDKYSLFDYVGDSCIVELKSRRNNYNKYPSTMIGYNKLEYAETIQKNIFFCFSFTDGLYYWKYTKNDYDKIIFKNGGRNDRGKAEFKKYAYIDISLLKMI